MTEEDFPEELRGMSEAEAEERAQELQREAAEAGQRLSEEQAELLEDLDDEHGGDRIETEVVLPGGNRGTIECVLNGAIINRMSAIDDQLASLEDPDTGDLRNLEGAMDEAAAVLADITREAKYSKELFYAIYERYGPEALGAHVEASFDAIEREVERKAGEAKGFRQQ